MPIADARKALIAEFAQWYSGGGGVGKAEDVFAFLKYLQEEKSYLLELKHDSDQY
jgi:hypothetical protein